MTVEVEVISTETIKPSSPTPDHLRQHNLSLLDQLQPPIFMPMVLFYPKEPDHDPIHHHNTILTERCTRIKKALSQALTKFYPLAGRVRGTQYVDCNDEGAYYVEAKTTSQISDVIQNPIPSDFNKFLPLELDTAHELPICLQVTTFACGGMSIAMGMSHKVADALSYFIFLNSLAAITRGGESEGNLLLAPDFVADKYYPQKDLSGLYQPRSGIVKHNISTKRFVFEAPAIASLRAQCTDTANEHARRPTRVEALSTFIWSRYIVACTNPTQHPHTTYTVSHAVNLRTRMDPPLSENTFGNVTRTAISVPPLPVDPKAGSLHGIVNHVREGIKQVDGEYIKKLQEGDGYLSFLKERTKQFMSGEIDSFSFTSLCRFPIYDADFGWGKPVYVGSMRFNFKNLVSFFDTTAGDGVEAWINLKEEDMEKFEADEEFLKYVSLSSTPHSKNSGVNGLIY